LNTGIDFGDGAPRPCSHELPRGADVVVEFIGDDATSQFSGDVRRITIGPANSSAEVSFVTPGLAVGLAAQVMRFDGIMLWLCDDPATAPPDPAADPLLQLRQLMEVRQ